MEISFFDLLGIVRVKIANESPVVLLERFGINRWAIRVPGDWFLDVDLSWGAFSAILNYPVLEMRYSFNVRREYKSID